MGKGLSRNALARVREFAGRYDLHITSPAPVLVRKIAAREGWQVQFSFELHSCYAVAVVLPGVAKAMLVNDNIGIVYQRFAIMHEMMHDLLEHGGGYYACQKAGGAYGRWAKSKQEREADLAAAWLLVPQEALDWNRSVAETAHLLAVPEMVVEWRMAMSSGVSSLMKLPSSTMRTGQPDVGL